MCNHRRLSDPQSPRKFRPRQEAEARHQARVTARRQQRDEANRALWRERLEPALAPGLPVEERLRRVAQALASKGWKIQVKDLTPELRNIADVYLTHYGEREIVRPSELWLSKLSATSGCWRGRSGIRP